VIVRQGACGVCDRHPVTVAGRHGADLCLVCARETVAAIMASLDTRSPRPLLSATCDRCDRDWHACGGACATKGRG